MESKFAILQYEGILSSIKVASAGPAFVQALLDTDNFVSVLLDVVQKEETIIPEGSRPKGPNDVNVPPVALQLLSALVDTGAHKAGFLCSLAFPLSVVDLTQNTAPRSFLNHLSSLFWTSSCKTRRNPLI
jgi:hypothetical protein